MRYQADLGKGRLISRCLLFVLMLFWGAAVQGVERIYYHINDPSGSPVMVVDAEGAVMARYVYTPFGSQQVTPASASQRLGFVGGIRETPGLHYLKHRYYNPQLGRFYQPDPVDFLRQGAPQINRYSYGANDPYTYRDRSGREFTQIPDEALSTLRVSGSDILSFQWLRQAFAGNISSEDNRQLNSRFLESYVEEQRNFVKSGGVLFLLGPGEELFFSVGIRSLPFRDYGRLVEINRALDRIEAGGPFPYRRDGIAFRNREGILPDGSYLEYTVETSGAGGRGARRIVREVESDRTYYTDDHYRNFVEIDPVKR